MIRSLLPVTLLASFACSVASPTLEGGVILNSTGRELRQVRVVHQPTGRVVLINVLLPGREFDLGFQPRPLMASEAEITWLDARLGERRAVLALPEHAKVVGPQRLVYELHAAGNATVRLEPALD